MKKPITISIVNAKGGVGKTTSTLNIGAGLALQGYKVLLIDIDLQANLTHSLIGDLPEDQPSIADCLLNETGLEDVIVKTSQENLSIVPSGDALIGVDINLVSALGRERILENCITSTKDINDYDVILIDNPPYMSLVTMNSLVASDFYLIPTSCDYLPSIGIRLLSENIEKIQRKLNPKLSMLGILLTAYDKREAITEQVENILRENFKELVFNTPIRINTKFKTSPVEHQTIFQYDQRGKGAEDYQAVCSEIEARLQRKGLLSQEKKAVNNG